MPEIESPSGAGHHGHDDGRDVVRGRSGVVRTPVHHSITEAQIAALVDTFYDDVWADPRLGPIFAARVADRPQHLTKMKAFWSSVLRHTGRYSGRPMPVHMRLSEVEEADFAIWLRLFRQAANRAFHPDAAPLVIAASERIARSFWMAMFGGIVQRP